MGFADDRRPLPAAGDSGPMTPKHTLNLGGRGEPTVAMLTAKGGSTLWVGTSAGEVRA